MICRFGWVDPGRAENIQHYDSLFGKFVPKLEWEIHICGAKAANDMIFERLDCAFGCIDSVICWLYKLPCTILLC